MMLKLSNLILKSMLQVPSDVFPDDLFFCVSKCYRIERRRSPARYKACTDMCVAKYKAAGDQSIQK